MILNVDQHAAREEILDWAAKHPRVISLQGAAGTGKTTLLAELLPELRAKFRKVIFTGMTGKAALRVQQVAGAPATTLHKALYEPPTEHAHQVISFDQLQDAPVGSLLVVDEASMITPDTWEDLLKWVESGVSVLLVGDGYQLPPVLTGKDAKVHGDSFSVFAHVPGPRLNRVMRLGDDILDVATRLREEQTITRETRGAYGYVSGLGARAVAQVHAAKVAGEVDAACITWRNASRMGLNTLVRMELGRAGDPQPGEPVLFCKNGYGVLNGEVAVMSELVDAGRLGPVAVHEMSVRGREGRRILVSLGGKEERMDGSIPFLKDDAWREFVSAKRAARVKGDPVPVTWGYVLTAHKAQGSEFDDVTVYLDADDGNSRPFLAPSRLPDGTSVPFWCRWLYTALTRAKKRAALVMGG